MPKIENGVTKASPTSSKGIGDSTPNRASISKRVQFVVADTEELRERAFRLRYRAYCLENAYEPAWANPGERETDEYDIQSLHGVLLHRPTSNAVGAVRLILPELNGSAKPLPIRKFCEPRLLEAMDCQLSAFRAAEISRFAIPKTFQRCVEEGNPEIDRTNSADPCNQSQRAPQIFLGLMQGVIELARLADVTHLCAIMEPALIRMLRSLSINLESLGPMVEYHGWRQPCYCGIEDLVATTLSKRPDIWTTVTDSGRLHHASSGDERMVNSRQDGLVPRTAVPW